MAIIVMNKTPGADWKKVRENFEKEIAAKLCKLPDHREVSENLRDFRGIISHELPETTSEEIYQKLISILLEGKDVDTNRYREKYLTPELEKEKEILEKYKKEFEELRCSARDWVNKNLPEEELQRAWKEHQTWLPRRYTIYENPNTAFQEITIDTLARYALIASKKTE
jgi:hypothetical protein